MDAYDRFHGLLKRDFFPLLRADSFKGNGTTFWRVRGERIDVVNVQGSRYGGKCCVNLAAHFSFLPSMGGGQVAEPKKFKEYHCAFRNRLREEREDHWWDYGTTDADAEASVASLVDLYQRRGALFFQKFEPFPDAFDIVTPAQLDARDLTKMPAAMTQVFAALTMARIMKHLARLEKCREFADVGLRHLGQASGLKAELQSLREAG